MGNSYFYVFDGDGGGPRTPPKISKTTKANALKIEMVIEKNVSSPNFEILIS